MATTHYSELKVYALSTPGVENACCEFDVESLRPTYRLLIGIPGKSNAFAISSKLGLPDYIIDDAKQRLSEQDVSFEDLLSDLETSRRTIEKEREEIAAYRREAESLKEQAAQRQAKLDEQRDRIIREANEKANAILREAKEVADETIRNFHKFGKENISAAEMEKERERLRKKIKDTSSASSLGSQKPKKNHKPSDFKLGESVKVLSMNLTGTVSSLPDSRGNVTVPDGHPPFPGQYIRPGDHRRAIALHGKEIQPHVKREDRHGQIPFREPGDQPSRQDSGRSCLRAGQISGRRPPLPPEHGTRGARERNRRAAQRHP